MYCRKMLTCLTATLLLGAATQAGAAGFGVRAGSYTDAGEGFIGVEYLKHYEDKIFLNPNIEWVLADGLTYLTFNADAHYDFHQQGQTTAWAGGGLGLAYLDPDSEFIDSQTELGVNALLGASYDIGKSFLPYAQAKLVLGDADDLVIGLGVRF